MINHPTIEEIMNNKIEVSLPFGIKPEDMSKEELIKEYKSKSEILGFLNEDSERHKKCKSIAVRIVVYSSRLNQLGAIINDNDGVDTHQDSKHELHELILNELKELKKANCNFLVTNHDENDNDLLNTSNKLLDDLIYEFGNLDYNRSYELGNQTLQIFSYSLVNEYL